MTSAEETLRGYIHGRSISETVALDALDALVADRERMRDALLNVTSVCDVDLGEVIEVRVSAGQKAEILRLARVQRRTVSGLVREAVLGVAVNEGLPPEYRDALRAAEALLHEDPGEDITDTSLDGVPDLDGWQPSRLLGESRDGPSPR